MTSVFPHLIVVNILNNSHLPKSHLTSAMWQQGQCPVCFKCWTFHGFLGSLTRKWPYITRNWVRCGGSSQTNGPLGTCLLFWCGPCVVCFYCPRLFLLWLCLPLGLDLALRINLWVLTGCWLVSYCDAALYWLVDVHCHPPPAVPQDWWAVMDSAGSVVQTLRVVWAEQVWPLVSANSAHWIA